MSHDPPPPPPPPPGMPDPASYRQDTGKVQPILNAALPDAPPGPRTKGAARGEAVRRLLQQGPQTP